MVLITVHDRVGATWSNPVAAQNEASAIRDFELACKQPGTLMSERPGDFELVALAEWQPAIGDAASPRLIVFEQFKILKLGGCEV